MGGPGGPPHEGSLRLEDELSLQLDYSRGGVRAQTGAVDGRRLANRLGDLAELAAVCVRVWESKVRMIQEVEESCTYRELALLPFRNDEGLLYVEVRVKVSRATKLIAALSSKIIYWIHEIRRVIARGGLSVHELRSGYPAVNVWRSHDIGENRGRGRRACASEQASL